MLTAWSLVGFLLPAIVVMQPFPIRAIGYNPLAMILEERAIDILEEASNFDFLLVCGTAIRASPTGKCKQFEHTGFTCISAGWENAFRCQTKPVAVQLPSVRGLAKREFIHLCYPLPGWLDEECA